MACRTPKGLRTMQVVFACLLVATVCVTIAVAVIFTSDSAGGGGGGGFSDIHWTWRCEAGNCVRYLADNSSDGMQLNKCKLVCGNQSMVWPQPTGPANFGNDTVSFAVNNVKVKLSAPEPVKPLLQLASEIFLLRLEMMQPVPKTPRKPGCSRAGKCDAAVASRVLQVALVVDGANTQLDLTTDESYQLLITYQTDAYIQVIVHAPTFFGARHGLETLAQLIDSDDDAACLQALFATTLSDAPVYPIRALTLDTSRNFVSLTGLRRTIDAMAMNKLNTLHWHITDTDSFPLDVSREPRMAQYGAYSPDKVYSAQDVRELVDYALPRGVRLLPELDAPAHVGYGWQWGEKAGLGELAVCVGKEPWQQYCVEPPCGQMNIVNDNMYEVLEKIYADYDDLFRPDIFHMGGDEINIDCWKSTPEIANYVAAHGGDPDDDQEYMKLWTQYQVRAADLWRNVTAGRHTKLVLWTSDLTAAPAINTTLDPDDYFIQVWTTGDDQHIGDLLAQRYQLIMSNYDAWYLDCGFSAWVGAGNNWCAPFKSWQTVYENSPRAIAQHFQTTRAGDGAATGDYAAQMLGGSAALWAEQSDDQTLDARLWPRAAALAERLWAEPTAGAAAALTRLVHHRERLVRWRVGAEPVQPEYCHQNDGVCRMAAPPEPTGARPDAITYRD